MEAFYESMKVTGNNNLENIITWMKGVHLINDDTEESIRKMFSGANANDVSFDHFKDVVSKVAGEKKVDMNTLFQGNNPIANVANALGF